jgi:hypothetical protein
MATPDLTRLLTGFQGRLVKAPTYLLLPRPTGALAASFAAGNCSPGQHAVGFTFVYGTAGESPMPATGAVSSLSAFSAGLDTSGLTVPADVTAVNVYAGVVGGTALYLVGSTAPGGTVTFNVSDAALALLPRFSGSFATQTSATFPFGGTQLGEVMDLVATPRRRTKELTAEEYGGETIEVADAGESWKLTAALRGVDPDLFGLVMAVPAVTGSPSGRPVVTYPGAQTQIGSFLTQRSGLPFAMLLVPTDFTRLPSFLFYATIPVLEASARLTAQLDREGMLGAVFHLLRANATGQPRNKQVVQWGMLEDLSLT